MRSGDACGSIGRAEAALASANVHITGPLSDMTAGVSLVTDSAPYGAGGSEVGPALAERLGVPFVDRLIPVQVAARLAIPSDAALAHAEAATSGRLMRLLMSAGSLTQEYGTPGPSDYFADRHACREATERVVHEHSDCGRGVILGRAAALVLCGDPRALHVRLDGPRDARLRQAGVEALTDGVGGGSARVARR